MVTERDGAGQAKTPTKTLCQSRKARKVALGMRPTWKSRLGIFLVVVFLESLAGLRSYGEGFEVLWFGETSHHTGRRGTKTVSLGPKKLRRSREHSGSVSAGKKNRQGP